MSISPMLTRFLVQEHLRSPLTGKKVLTLGRQSVLMNLDEAVAICRSEGYNPDPSLIEHISKIQEKDRDTRGGGDLTDKAFFALFGVEDLDSMDHSSYEKCSIVHNLNTDVPTDLHGKYDYIVDGGTLDHIVDAATALKGISLMLKDGGRLYLWNACSNYTIGTYFSFSPAFFFDYFAANNFTNCRTFLSETDDMGSSRNSDIYIVDPLDHGGKMSCRFLLLIFFAQKRADGSSTCGKMPIVTQYRTDGEKQLYAEIAKESSAEFCLTKNPFLKNQRPPKPLGKRISRRLRQIVYALTPLKKRTRKVPGFKLVAKF